MPDTYLSNAFGSRVDPATEDQQLCILTELEKSTATNSANFGTQRITFDGSGHGAGANQICRECWISFQVTDDVHLAVKNSGDADAEDFLLPPDVIIPLPVRNTSQIKLFGTSGEFVYLLWRD